MPVREESACAVWLSQAAVAALVTERWRTPPPQLRQIIEGEVAGAHYKARWARPALSFPADAPGTVRFGLAAEGGVSLPSGRTLSLDAFVTATGMPQVTRDETGCFARLATSPADTGVVRLTYAGQPLPVDAPGMASGLPTPDEAQALMAALADELARAFEEQPDVPLSYTLAAPVHDSALASRVAPAVLGMGIGDLPPVGLPPGADGAIVLAADDLSEAFEAVAEANGAQPIAEGAIAAQSLSCGQGALVMTLTFTAHGAEPENIELAATPLVTAGRLTLACAPVDGASARAAELAANADVAGWLAGLAQSALLRALAPLLGEGAVTLDWAWLVARSGETLAVTFAPERVTCDPTALVLSGSLPIATSEAEELTDAASVELALIDGPDDIEGDDARRVVTVRAVNARDAAPPYDYAWWTTLAPAMRAEHTPGLRALIPVARPIPADPEDTLPRRPHTSLPPGQAQITVALIDAFGRVARADLVIDAREGAIDSHPTIEATSTARRSGPIDDENLPASLYAPTGMGTIYRTTVSPRVAYARSSIWGMLAGALATFALLATAVTIVLVQSLSPHPPNTTNIQPSVTLSIAITLTPAATVATSTPTPTATTKPTPTATSVPFGRFSLDVTTLQFVCAGDNTTQPLSVNVTNSGTAPLTWTVQAIEKISGQPWATFSPASGKLAPKQQVVVTVTPLTPDFCVQPAASVYHLQFTAPGAVPFTVTASHS